ncbi:MAG: GAF domain-containing protein, partial [Nevskiales bacterium]
MTETHHIPDRRSGALSSLTGEFINSQQENDFRAGIRPVWLRRVRSVILTGLAANLITTVNDYVLLGAGLSFGLLVAARLVLILQGLGYLLLVHRNHSVRIWDFGLLLFVTLLVTAFLGMVLARPDGMRVTAPAAILVLCVLYMVPMTRLWVTALGAAYLSLGMFVVGYYSHATPTPALIVLAVQLLCTNLIGYIVCRGIHKDVRIAWINQQSLERRERHQRLLASLSSQFLGLRPNQFDDAIAQAFRLICKQTDSDRAYLMEFDAQYEWASMTHEWCAEGIPQTRTLMQNIPAGRMPWASLKMQRGEIVQADRVSDLPPEASAERDLNIAQGVKSFLCVPLSHEGLLLGMIGLDRVRQQRSWDADTVSMLRFIGQVIFNA